MNSFVETQSITTGSDPRALPEFSAIREEINKSNHPSQPELNWKLVESLALAIFKTNGVDLHTVAYYTLARTRTQGLIGFCEGTELLAAMITHEWDKFWPQAGSARSEMLDWFNTRTGNILRQQLSFSDSDLAILHRTEVALQLLCNKLQQVELTRQPRVENLLYFVQNTRKRLEPKPKSEDILATSFAAVRTLVYAPESVSSPVENQPPLPALPDVRIAVCSGSRENSQNEKSRHTIAKGFIAGLGCAAIISAGLWWWRVYPMKQQLLSAQNSAQGAALLWLSSPDNGRYATGMQHLLEASPLMSLNLGEQMRQTAESLWPEDEQQQHISSLWFKTLQTRAESSPQLSGWQQTRQDLRAFSDLLEKREQAKEGFTLSYIKTVVYQAERSLNQDIPLEYLLTQYQEARMQGLSTEVQEQLINERLNGVLSRWMLLQENTTENNK
ncbi:MAG TPA: VasL domain-containing protein [Scandinavium sp.]|jgi:type VI secretion system protein VasL|uniref:VasL domain-containing protein n=1 Tax=Scandinavium sp. TaxID=2830653 RepID=UPI002E3150AF|nr:VasL domain-containing protein [Scandinavium sp.]HEX4504019.1 VasL domain-containing protein [Scandinavium sp.]